MAHRLQRDNEADGWERSDFPIICGTCLGDNPFFRMTKAHYDKECKICTRPFTVFRWRPGKEARYKKTEICQTCCKLKNVCQVCLLDLEYGLPVQVRDTALSISTHDAIPKSDVDREYFAEEHDRRARAGLDYESSYGKVRPNDTILKLQRTTPYYKRNRAHICSFYIRGECTRGAECPYRHEMPVTGELSQQNIKDRYYGVNDPVANNLLNKAGEMQTLEPPEDESIKTLYVGGLDARITEQDLRDNFYAHGEIESIRMVLQRACAFVTYTTREAAEKAVEELSNKLVINGLRLKLMWGRPQQPKPEMDGSGQAKQQASVAHSGMLPRAVISQQHNQINPPGMPQDQIPPPMPYFNIPPPPQQDRAYYPSMDPQQMGAVIPSQDGACSSGDDKSGTGKHPHSQLRQQIIMEKRKSPEKTNVSQNMFSSFNTLNLNSTNSPSTSLSFLSPVLQVKKTKVPNLVSLCIGVIGKHLEDLIPELGEVATSFPTDIKMTIAAIARRRKLLTNEVIILLADETWEILDISCSDVSDFCLTKLAKMCRFLRAVDISRCKNITPDGVSQLVQLCPSLETLRCGGCPRSDFTARRSLGLFRPNLNNVEGDSWEELDTTEITQGGESLRWIVWPKIDPDLLENFSSECPRIKINPQASPFEFNGAIIPREALPGIVLDDPIVEDINPSTWASCGLPARISVQPFSPEELSMAEKFRLAFVERDMRLAPKRAKNARQHQRRAEKEWRMSVEGKVISLASQASKTLRGRN